MFYIQTRQQGTKEHKGHAASKPCSHPISDNLNYSMRANQDKEVSGEKRG